MLRVDAQAVVDQVVKRVDESDIFTSGVTPTSVKTVRSDKDCAFVGEWDKAVIVGAGNRAHVPVEPVEAKDDLVLLITIVVVWHAEGVLTVLAINSDGFDTARQGSLATASCAA